MWTNKTEMNKKTFRCDCGHKRVKEIKMMVTKWCYENLNPALGKECLKFWKR